MVDLTSVITLLQLVLTILSNPSLASNPVAQNLANQAVSLATQALIQIPTSTVYYAPPPFVPPTSTEQLPPIQVPQNLGTVETIKSCVLTVTPTCHDFTASDCTGNIYTEIDGLYSWTSVGISDPTIGQLYYVIPQNAFNPERHLALGKSITQSQGQQLITSGYGPALSSETDNFMLKLDNTVCTTTWVGRNADGTIR